MSIGEDKKIISQMYRTNYTNSVYSFEEIVMKSVLKANLTNDKIQAELMANKKLNKLWKMLQNEVLEDENNGIVPLFSIINEYDKKVTWIGDATKYGKKKSHYVMRPELYKFFDKLNDREYEKMACVICELLGADKIHLTAAGNEGGIDFFARIPFNKKSHFLFGVKGPVRIVGQCKMYSSKDNVGHMKEFVQTMQNVYNKSFRAGEVIPDWFKMENGSIIGWHISNLGHQSGALDVAKNYGILVSDTKQLIDIVCKSKINCFENRVIDELNLRIEKY